MPINWLLETIKWNLLIKHIKPISFKQTLLDVVAGISTSLLTPNRIGNFIGRTIHLDKRLKIRAIILTIHSNLAQFTASIVFGFIGLMLIHFNSEYLSVQALRVSAALIILLGLLIYFYPKCIDFNPISRMYSRQMKKGIELIQELRFKLKLIIFGLSLVRYLVFLSQFYLLLSCFSENIEYHIIIPAISVVYLITTIIPSFLFGKLFVREVSALFILTTYGISTPIILATVFILWLVNLAIPSIIGWVVLMRTK